MSNQPGDLNQDSGLSSIPSLLQELRSGNASAWREFCQLYAPFVYGCCRRWGFSAGESEVIGRDLMLKIHQTLHAPSAPPDPFHPWVVNALRKRLTERSLLQGSVVLKDADLQTFVIDDIDQNRLWLRALQQLSSSIKASEVRVFELTVLNHQGVAAAAEELQLEVTQVAIIRGRCLRLFRQRYSGIWPDASH